MAYYRMLLGGGTTQNMYSFLEGLGFEVGALESGIAVCSGVNAASSEESLSPKPEERKAPKGTCP